MQKKFITKIKNIALAVTMLGAINWGLVGFFDFEIFSYFLGAQTISCKIIYIFIGLCALFSATFAVIDCQCFCEKYNKK